jgi:transcriptional regulator
MTRQLAEMLSPKQFAVFMARAQGADYRMIAWKLGTTPGAARVHEAKAKQKLEKLREVGKVA